MFVLPNLYCHKRIFKPNGINISSAALCKDDVIYYTEPMHPDFKLIRNNLENTAKRKLVLSLVI